MHLEKINSSFSFSTFGSTIHHRTLNTKQNKESVPIRPRGKVGGGVGVFYEPVSVSGVCVGVLVCV